MADLQTWWEIAQVAGAGAAVVLAPMAWLLWKRVQTDTDYIREADKNTLNVLNQLTQVISSDDQTRYAPLLVAIRDAVGQIKEHIDERIRPRD